MEQQAHIATHQSGQQDGSILALAESMAAQDRHAVAIPLFRQAIGAPRSAPDRARVYAGLATSLMAIGQYDQAEEKIGRAHV